jgi:hypothetical protein
MRRAQENDPAASDIWGEYRDAFADFAAKVRSLQSLSAQPYVDRTRLDETMLEVERARLKYNNYRDSLVDQILPSSTAGLPPAIQGHPSQDYAAHIREIAELLWELSGRPDGTEKEDWARAEEIIRRTD